MGECAYYLKAEFPTKSDAQIAAKQLNDFFLETMDAYNFYQSEREEHNKTFWEPFKKKFPLVTEYVKSMKGKWGKNPSDLSGLLDFGQDKDNLTIVQENTVGWCDGCVWHMADWTPVCKFIKQKYKAIKVVWDMEENGCGSLDSLQLYDWEEIVKDILKHKELHPMLIGINDELNTLLETAIKEKRSCHITTA